MSDAMTREEIQQAIDAEHARIDAAAHIDGATAAGYDAKLWSAWSADEPRREQRASEADAAGALAVIGELARERDRWHEIADTRGRELEETIAQRDYMMRQLSQLANMARDYAQRAVRAEMADQSCCRVEVPEP